MLRWLMLVGALNAGEPPMQPDLDEIVRRHQQSLAAVKSLRFRFRGASPLSPNDVETWDYWRRGDRWRWRRVSVPGEPAGESSRNGAVTRVFESPARLGRNLSVFDRRGVTCEIRPSGRFEQVGAASYLADRLLLRFGDPKEPGDLASLRRQSSRFQLRPRTGPDAPFEIEYRLASDKPELMHVLELDPKSGWLPRRRATFTSGKITNDITVTGFAEANGVFFPAGSTWHLANVGLTMNLVIEDCVINEPIADDELEMIFPDNALVRMATESPFPDAPLTLWRGGSEVRRLRDHSALQAFLWEERRAQLMNGPIGRTLLAAIVMLFLTAAALLLHRLRRLAPRPSVAAVS